MISEEDQVWLKQFVGKKVYLMKYKDGFNIYLNGGRFYKMLYRDHINEMERIGVEYHFPQYEHYDMSRLPLYGIDTIVYDLDYCHSNGVECSHSGKVYYKYGYDISVLKIPKSVIVENLKKNGKTIPEHFLSS